VILELDEMSRGREKLKKNFRKDANGRMSSVRPGVCIIKHYGSVIYESVTLGKNICTYFTALAAQQILKNTFFNKFLIIWHSLNCPVKGA